MSRPVSARLSGLCASCTRRFNGVRSAPRLFSTTTQCLADPDPSSEPTSQRRTRQSPGLSNIMPAFDQPSMMSGIDANSRATQSVRGSLAHGDSLSPQERKLADTYHFHVLAHKHNTHITLTNPQRQTMLSLSAGNIGFRKANRGTFDAAYQLAGYVLNRIQEQGWMNNIVYTEVILRGFGIGREAVTKALLGYEGQRFRTTVWKVSDHTRLKFGGTRSRKPRRLG